MEAIIDRLVRYQVACAKAIEMDLDDILAAQGQPKRPDSFGHENYAHGAHVFLALHQYEHAANPYFGRDDALATYIRLVDTWVDVWERSLAAGEPHGFAEWPPFITCRGLELVGDRLDPPVRDRWERFVAWFVEDELPQPFFSTSPNHEAWKLAMIATAGQALGRPEWVEQAAFECRQLIAYQTAEGFWEEGRHHGPSMKYNSLMVSGMALVARRTGDADILAAAGRLARLMAEWCFPDGVTVGAFDGRQSTSPGYFGRVVPGLELAPCGLTHVGRILEFWDRAGWLDDPRATGPSNWYAYFGMPFGAEFLLDLPDMKPHENAHAPLPLDEPAVTLENHTTCFDGLMLRRGRWIVAASGQLSDVPKDGMSSYRLARQNRIEIWHEAASVVVGGGHNRFDEADPLFNAWVDSGCWDDLTALDAEAASNPRSTAMKHRRSLYFPRAAASGLEGDTAWLELTFTHATVRFEIAPDGDELAIVYRYRALPMRELRLALPLLLWRGATATVDGEPLTEGSGGTPVKREVRVDTPAFGTATTLTVPDEGATRVKYPLWPVRTYGKLFDDERFTSFFAIALVETVLSAPAREGAGQWRLRVECP